MYSPRMPILRCQRRLNRQGQHRATGQGLQASCEHSLRKLVARGACMRVGHAGRSRTRRARHPQIPPWPPACHAASRRRRSPAGARRQCCLNAVQCRRRGRPARPGEQVGLVVQVNEQQLVALTLTYPTLPEAERAPGAPRRAGPAGRPGRQAAARGRGRARRARRPPPPARPPASAGRAQGWTTARGRSRRSLCPCDRAGRPHSRQRTGSLAVTPQPKRRAPLLRFLHACSPARLGQAKRTPACLSLALGERRAAGAPSAAQRAGARQRKGWPSRRATAFTARTSASRPRCRPPQCAIRSRPCAGRAGRRLTAGQAAAARTPAARVRDVGLLLARCLGARLTSRPVAP